MAKIDFSKGNSFGISSLNLRETEEEINLERYTDFSKPDDYYLGQDSKEIEYNSSCILNNIHWGQLKLFCSELFLFVNFLSSGNKYDIVYIGAAPGNHIFILSKYFPNLTFHLYDSEKFDKRLDNLKNIKIYQKYFDSTDIDFWKGKEFILISDIRTLSYDPVNNDDEKRILNEKNVWEDMKTQKNWIEILNPMFSLIKFRLPFAYDFIIEEGETRDYLDGRVCLQVYNKPTSSETRLLVQDITYKSWNLKKYERQMYRHNCVIRNKKNFTNPVDGSRNFIYEEMGLFNDFDSTYFSVIVLDYMSKYKNKFSYNDFKKEIDYILKNLTQKKTNMILKKAGF